ncbi:hydroxymethylpyrimidine/phosphomethylpyrimidine kinase [Aquimarina muelleri]|uniref:hydroxymethylpyrimidine kinase n=1 Tax=Aquimarina muelleri TaxID=279356 RepID=A0A918N156_9FLAO|nr:hydroxymethylpyrimidine/phosphomethylpyrimidine kinase [Aquimarina muelleri]MCX2764263.1 hydroxymethylpyrimidine/phosphomethylpyrimidine kinase [Aquimarina muelleri]GGX08017.1 hydroxymethylpyrimidine/phosphomethylpyrimidine kinase [Aquimarina muelleri]
MKKRPYILTIAGFDPSNGAGLTADIKTIEALKGYGLAVCTANTIQNDIQFKECIWQDIEVIKNQIEIILDRFAIRFVKIGIVQDWRVANQIIDFLLEKNKTIKIVLDPVLKSSSDFDFHDHLPASKSNIQFDQILDKIYLLTPNYPEIEKLYVDKTVDETVAYISSKTNLFLKGGHRKDTIGKDELFTVTGKHYILHPKAKKIAEKHGSGCILSAAITTQLALGFPLLKACFRGKRYTEKVLSSNTSLLGYHKM